MTVLNFYKLTEVSRIKHLPEKLNTLQKDPNREINAEYIETTIETSVEHELFHIDRAIQSVTP